MIHWVYFMILLLAIPMILGIILFIYGVNKNYEYSRFDKPKRITLPVIGFMLFIIPMIIIIFGIAKDILGS